MCGAQQVKYQKYQVLMLKRYTPHLLIISYLVMIHTYRVIIDTEWSTNWNAVASDTMSQRVQRRELDFHRLYQI